MNKKKGIIIGVFALIITMVVGYALFSKNIEIKGTAKAQGSFDLTYTCVEESFSTATGTCTVDKNTITVTSNSSKPDDTYQVNVTITNTGTIPATLKTVDSPNNYDIPKSTNGELVAGDMMYIDATTFLGAHYEIGIGENTYYGDSEAEAAKMTIQPGESMTMTIGIGWINSDNLGMVQPKLPESGANIEYNITLGFAQAE